MMPEKDPTTYSLLTYAWVSLLSAWGGAVNWLRQRRDGTICDHLLDAFDPSGNHCDTELL